MMNVLKFLKALSRHIAISEAITNRSSLRQYQRCHGAQPTLLNFAKIDAIV